jgi:DNA repair exonuclease SbcCD nuclease subunit
MKFLHAADIHLDSPLRGLALYEGAPLDALRGATRQAFDKLIELAIDEQVDFVLLAGDLYDGDWKDYNTGLYFINCMETLNKANIRVLMISGNHDASSQLSKSLRLPANTHLFNASEAETVVLETLGVAVHGQSFINGKITTDLSERYPEAKADYFNIGLLHTSLNGREGHDTYAPCSQEGLRQKHYHYWALGHVHKREVISEDPWIVFSGNIQGRHIRESDPQGKGCTLVEVVDQQIIKVEHQPVDVLRWFSCQVDATDCDSIDLLLQQIEQVLAGKQAEHPQHFLAIRLIISGSCTVHHQLQARSEYWQQEFRAQANMLGNLWLEKIQLKTSAIVDIEQALQSDDEVGSLLRYLQLEDNQETALAEQQALQDWLQQTFKQLGLPEEYGQTEAHFNPEEVEQWKELQQSAKAQLFQALIKTTGEK